MVRLTLLGNVISVRENPWLRTPFGKKGYVLFNITGRRAKLEKHPKVVERWKLFTSVRPEATAACASYSGVEKMACIARTMGAKLRK